MYTVTNTQRTRKVTLQPISKPEPVYTHSPVWKTCQHCRFVFQSMHGHSQHCYECASCGQHKPFSAIAGKAQYQGYICKACYSTKAYVRAWAYTLLLRF